MLIIKIKRRWNKIPRITWSKEQLTFLQENFREYTDEELANLLNHSPYTYNSIDTISQYLLTQINNQQTK